MRKLFVGLVAVLVLAFAATASADTTVNIGRNCTITAETPTYSAGTITFQGDNDCNGWPTRKQVTVCLQVWFGGWGNVPGQCLSSDTTGTGGVAVGGSFNPGGSGQWRTAIIVTDSDRGGGTWTVSGGTTSSTLTT
jgi:hypothetical protein